MIAIYNQYVTPRRKEVDKNRFDEKNELLIIGLRHGIVMVTSTFYMFCRLDIDVYVRS